MLNNVLVGLTEHIKGLNPNKNASARKSVKLPYLAFFIIMLWPVVSSVSQSLKQHVYFNEQPI